MVFSSGGTFWKTEGLEEDPVDVIGGAGYSTRVWAAAIVLYVRFDLADPLQCLPIQSLEKLSKSRASVQYKFWLLHTCFGSLFWRQVLESAKISPVADEGHGILAPRHIFPSCCLGPVKTVGHIRPRGTTVPVHGEKFYRYPCCVAVRSDTGQCIMKQYYNGGILQLRPIMRKKGVCHVPRHRIKAGIRQIRSKLTPANGSTISHNLMLK